MADPMIVVLVHGWSVHSTETYGKLPERLKSAGSPAIDIRHIWLSRYVSFRDEVRLEDLARGFEAAIHDELASEIQAKRKIACITHSTGGPVVREWWDRFYVQEKRVCPLSHFIMLAPANFGSALAQLGKERLSRLRSNLKGVEPGQGVLDWLELGSPESWDLNTRWIRDYPDPSQGTPPTFLFCLTGQWIDRKLYDHVNSYTGEVGSDGTVRVAAANLNATYLRLEQEAPVLMSTDPTGHTRYKAPGLNVVERHVTPRTAFAILARRSHTGENDGILYSIKNDDQEHPTVTAILRCLKVGTAEEYETLCDEFEQENKTVLEDERLETYERAIMPDIHCIHDAMSMVILRLRDDRGHTLDRFNIKITGPKDDPDMLPEGFFQDRQRNSRDVGTLTYFVNADKMAGTDAVRAGNRVIRQKIDPVSELGIEIVPEPRIGYVHYLTANLVADGAVLKKILKPNQTTLIDIVMRRCVREGVHRLTDEAEPSDFRGQAYGRLIDF